MERDSASTFADHGKVVAIPDLKRYIVEIFRGLTEFDVNFEAAISDHPIHGTLPWIAGEDATHRVRGMCVRMDVSAVDPQCAFAQSETGQQPELVFAFDAANQCVGLHLRTLDEQNGFRAGKGIPCVVCDRCRSAA